MQTPMNNGSTPLHTIEWRKEGFPHRRSGDPCALRHPSRYSHRRICFYRWAVWLRKDDIVVDPRTARYAVRRAVIRLKGNEVANLSFADRARIRNREIGFIFQSFNLIGDLTVFENVELPLTYRGMAASERKSFVTEALERVGMAHRAKHLPSQLSGGQQQRVAVARALAGRPAILLADEPTGNLDSRNGEAVMNLLRELHEGGATICMVTHDERFAQHADRTVHLFDGRVIEDRIAA